MNTLHIVCTIISILAGAFALFFGIFRRAGFHGVMGGFAIAAWLVGHISHDVLGLLPLWGCDLLTAACLITLAVSARVRFRHDKLSA